MSFDVEQHVRYRIANAPVLGYPFPHFYLEGVFPDEFYRELRSHLPELGEYKRLDETGTVAKGMYKERFICSSSELEEREFERGSGTFWAELNSWLLADEFAQLFLARFRHEIDERFVHGAELKIETDCRLVRDFTNYAISPHTDTPRKLVSLLFYLPADDSMKHLGTSIYAPVDPGLRCEGTAHHRREGFKKVATMEYKPNTLFAFFKTDRAFHGVDRIADSDVVRDLLLYNIYVTKVIGKQPLPPEKPGLSRLWHREKA
jgi:hypothetical protein